MRCPSHQPLQAKVLSLLEMEGKTTHMTVVAELDIDGNAGRIYKKMHDKSQPSRITHQFINTHRRVPPLPAKHDTTELSR